MDAAKEQDLLNKQTEKHKTMDAAKKQDLLNKQTEKYSKETRPVKQTNRKIQQRNKTC